VKVINAAIKPIHLEIRKAISEDTGSHCYGLVSYYQYLAFSTINTPVICYTCIEPVLALDIMEYIFYLAFKI